MSSPLDVKRVHFVGVGGYGMSALALVLLQKGYVVSGSDLKASALTETLAERGALIASGHRAENLGSAELVVYSTAIAAGNPELNEARRRGLPLWHRSELLAALLNNACGIAISGAHGKTTTTAMVTLLLEAGGLDPTALIGGVVPVYGSNARLGAGPYLVAEADESDRSFTRYYPQVALVTGIEADHLEHYDNDYALLQEAYVTFLGHLPPGGLAVLCWDDPTLRRLAARLSCRVASYALLEPGTENKPGPGHYHAAAIELEAGRSRFDFYHQGKNLAPSVHLSIPGLHNVSNAVGALAVAHCLGLDPAAVAPALAHFRGVKRRFEIIGTAAGVTVIDDYAHHPTEIKATLEAARPSGHRLICFFQPHRYTRTAAFFDDFAAAFGGADELLLHAVYGAGEQPIPGITAASLAAAVEQAGGPAVFHSDDIATLEEEAARRARPGDLIITMGAGDITHSAPRILALLPKTQKTQRDGSSESQL